MGRRLTTAQAAELAGMTPTSFRATAARARAAGVELRLPAEQWPDRRTPVYDSAVLHRFLTTRPGSGNRTPRRRPGDEPVASPPTE